MHQRFRALWLGGLLAVAAAAVLIGVPAATADEPSKISDEYLSQLSGSVALSYSQSHPDQASSRLRPFAEEAPHWAKGRWSTRIPIG